MNPWYKPRANFIGDRPAIKHSVTGESALVGKYGEIWAFDEDNICCCVIYSARVAKRYLPESHHPVAKGDESRWRFPIAELDLWCARLGITRNRAKMVRVAGERRQ